MQDEPEDPKPNRPRRPKGPMRFTLPPDAELPDLDLVALRGLLEEAAGDPKRRGTALNEPRRTASPRHRM